MFIEKKEWDSAHEKSVQVGVFRALESLKMLIIKHLPPPQLSDYQ